MSRDVYDLIIVGSGLEAYVAAARAAHHDAVEHILHLENIDLPLEVMHRETPDIKIELSPALHSYLSNSCALSPEAADFPAAEEASHGLYGVFSGGELRHFATSDLFAESSIKAFPGTSAKEWGDLATLAEAATAEIDFKKAAPLGKNWGHPRNGAASKLVENIAYAVGIPNIWQSHALCLRERLQYLQNATQPLSLAKIKEALHSLPQVAAKVTLQQSAITAAAKEEGLWQVQSTHGLAQGRRLLIAESPWNAVEWLDRAEMPLPLLKIALKSKATSRVTLTLNDVSMPNWKKGFFLIPSEDVYAAIDSGLELRASIDYEHSLDAAVVVKAVKRLKRAAAKLQKAFPELGFKGERLALAPFAWTQDCSITQLTTIRSLEEAAVFQKPQLAFCGASYGPSYSPEENFLSSLSSALQALLEKA